MIRKQLIKSELAHYRVFIGVSIFFLILFSLGMLVNILNGALNPPLLRSAADLQDLEDGNYVIVVSRDAQVVPHPLLFSESRRMRTTVTPLSGVTYYLSDGADKGYLANVPQNMSESFAQGGQFYAIINVTPVTGADDVLEYISAETGRSINDTIFFYNAFLYLSIQDAATPLGLLRWGIGLIALAALILLALLLTRYYKATHYYKLPFYVKLQQYGDPDAILQELDDQARNRTAVFHEKNLLITKNYLSVGKEILRTEDIMWLHLRYIYRVTTMFFFLADGNIRRTPCECDDETIERVKRACPGIIVGYSEELDKMSHQERLQYWEYYRSSRNARTRSK